MISSNEQSNQAKDEPTGMAPMKPAKK